MRRNVHSLRLLGTLVLLAVGLLRTPITISAQGGSAALAVSSAVAILEREGYVAGFRLEGSRTLQGEMRYASPLAYSLSLRNEDGAELEYILLDFVLYSRALPQPGGAWEPWERREWHPDVPVGSLQSFHPRLPLELLRAATSLTVAAAPADEPGATLIEGRGDFGRALLAAYEEPPDAADARRASEQPLNVTLDRQSGRARGLSLTIPPGAEGAFSGVITFEFRDMAGPLELRAPAEAIDIPSPLEQRPAPEQASQPLPLQSPGDGSEIASAPFVTGGSFLVTLSPGGSGLQYTVWRIKRGRQLVAAFGSVIGVGDSATIGVTRLSFSLPPGEYLFTAQQPEPSPWILLIQDKSPADAESR